MDHTGTASYLCFDPRDPAQSVGDRRTWKLSRNAILISATMLLTGHEEGCPILWERVATLADLCEDPEFQSEPPRRGPFASFEETAAMLRAVLATCPSRHR